MPIYVPGKVVLKKESVAADPYYNNVSLLLHGDGANGSTTIVDNSPTPKTVTAVGNAQISTAQSKFSGSSIAFDGTGAALTVLPTAFNNFGTGDFTIEAWIRPQTTTGVTIVGGRGPNNGTLMFAIESNQLRLGRNYVAWDIQSSPLAWAAQWYHVAATKSANVVYLFRDGSLLTSSANTQTYDLTSGSNASYAVGARQISSGLDNLGAFFNGYIDDLRITKDVARYTSNFNPPTAPFMEVRG